MEKTQKEDLTFLQWLSPPYFLVEAQLSSARILRADNTLAWAPKMTEFHTWCNSYPDSNERILWIRAPLGFGKTIMAGYFIELLKCLYPESVVAYFFCQHDNPALTTARNIIRTLAYQCIKVDPDARSVLDSLRCKELPIDDNVGVGCLFDNLLLEPLSKTEKQVFIVLDGLDELDEA